MNNTMNRSEITFKDLETVNGGTHAESCGLAVALSTFGHDDFLKHDGKETIDYEAIEKFFGSKGYTFIPSEYGPNLYMDSKGTLLTNMGIIEKIMTETL